MTTIKQSGIGRSPVWALFAAHGNRILSASYVRRGQRWTLTLIIEDDQKGAR